MKDIELKRKDKERILKWLGIEEETLRTDNTKDILEKLGIEEEALKTDNIRFYLTIYSDEELRGFERIYNCLNKLMERVEHPIIRDVTLRGFRELSYEVKRAVEYYNKYIPEEFKEKFKFDVSKLEEKLLSLQKEFVKY
ncbi:MAG: hypothetical protein PHW73_09830 [Atribacterota bacterium]|nr:hypothetical protein [Atribacterota bacterium]